MKFNVRFSQLKVEYVDVLWDVISKDNVKFYVFIELSSYQYIVVVGCYISKLKIDMIPLYDCI